MQVTLSRNFWRWFAQQCVKKAQAMVRPAVHLWKMLRCSRQLQCSGPAMADAAMGVVSFVYSEAGLGEDGGGECDVSGRVGGSAS